MSKKRSVLIISSFLAILMISAGLFRHFNQDENKRFEKYTHDFFCQEVSGNTITLHYTLKNPSDYGITDSPVSLGSCQTDTAAIAAYTENALARLHTYRRSRLSDANRLTYDVIEDYMTTLLSMAPYTLYEDPLAPLTGTQAQLPVLLSEYQFYNKNDADTYLELLKKTPEYFRSILQFEQARSEAGLFMSSRSADDIIKECTAFVEMEEENYLYSSFEERLNGLKLSDSERKEYISQNAACIQDYIFPAYIELKNGLTELSGTGKNNNGLSYFPHGEKYYELVVRSETGSSRSIPELKTLTQNQILDDLKAMQKVLATESSSGTHSVSSDIFKTQGAILEDSNPVSILSSLEHSLKASFPAPPDVNTKVKYVQKSMEDYLSPAFYMVPTIDNTKENVIYINQGHMTDDISLFTTLAHEGYPGHLYQNIYYASLNPDPVRSLLSFGGYTEGWATYTEMLSYYYSPLSKEQATLMQRNSSILLGLYALADIGIHYDGWTLVDTVSFFREYGITDTGTIEEIYDLIVADPGNYLKYYIGYVEFLELKKVAIEKWGDEFTQKRFHKAVLDVGPASFDMVRKYVF